MFDMRRKGPLKSNTRDVAQVSGTRVRWVCGHEYPIQLEALPKIAENAGLGATIIYINFLKYNLKNKVKKT